MLGLLLFAGSVAPALFRHLSSVCCAAGPDRHKLLVPGELISPKRPLPGRLQMKGWELLSLMAFHPAKCFVALFMTSVTREPGMKRLKASFYFCLQNSLSLLRICKFFSGIKVVAGAGLPLSCFIMLLTWTLNPAFLCCVLKVTAAVWS